MSDASARISFVTKSTKRERLAELAEAYGKNLSSVINDALDQYLELQEWQLAHIRAGLDAEKQGDYATDQEVESFFKQYGTPE